MQRVIASALIFLVTGCSTIPSRSPQSRITEIKDLNEISGVISEAPGRRTLLVLDIDDTVLTSATYFGSDRWYDRQSALGKGDPNKVRCIFDLIALNLEAGTQVPTQAGGPEHINSLSVDKIILTSRNPAYRGATIRELTKAGYDLPALLGDGREGLIYEWREGTTNKSWTVSYYNGVFMVSGRDKGLLLLDLMKRLNIEYDRIVLVDDGKKNIHDMEKALAAARIDYRGLHYTRVEKSITEENKKEEAMAWNAWRRFLTDVFPARLGELDSGRCFY